MSDTAQTPKNSSVSTTAGNYFISNYPPFSFWETGRTAEFHEKLALPPQPDAALGLYIHIPFCRKRCHFCYFKVYTDRNSAEIGGYLDALGREVRLYSEQPFFKGRKPGFIYFGGGTPSYLSPSQLESLVQQLKSAFPWDEAGEIAFEAEPGTLNESKLKMIRDIGVTRLSLGVENFNDDILSRNNRAHQSREIMRSYDYARQVGFPQINIDLIAGMIGETDENWHDCILKTLELKPDSITIYQMEIPFNTTIYKSMKEEGEITAPVADWDTKRRWVAEAFEALESEGYTITSAYTAVRDPAEIKFLYRDSLWTGADMLSLGVSSFGHLNGLHYQNIKDFQPYLDAVGDQAFPVQRTYQLNVHEKLVREFILQWKMGRIDRDYFIRKFEIDVFYFFSKPLDRLVRAGFVTTTEHEARISRQGLLQIDKLIRDFFLPCHQKMERYT
jgi:oxygen-independent coproporphyrinogen-3 oxidase